MALTASEVASLTRSLSHWELAEYVFGGLVTLACTGEFVANFTEWLTKGIEEKKKRLEKLSTLLLIVSLTFELICLVKTNQISGKVIGSLDEKAEEASKKSERAVTDADSAITKARTAKHGSESAKVESGKAKDVAGKAESLARGAQQEADTFKREIEVTKANLRKVMPRWQLLEDRKATFVDHMRAYSGQSIVIMECATKGMVPLEPFHLEQDLLNFLGKDGWKLGSRRWDTCPATGPTGVGGNMIYVAVTASPDVWSAAKALCEELKASAGCVMVLPIADMNPSELQTFLGGPDSPFALAPKDSKSMFLLVGPNPNFQILAPGEK